MITGQSLHTDNQSELLCYFCVQEYQQSIIDDKNEVLQAEAQAKLDCGQEILSQHAAQLLKANEKMRLKHARVKHQCGNPNSSTNKHCVCPEDPCPIHPMAGHNCGECYNNAGQHKDVKKNQVATNKVHKKKEKGQEANVSNIALATNKCVINDDHSFISDGEMMAEVCCFEQLDTNLMETTTVDSTETGTSASHNLSQVHIDLDKSVTHHLNELTLDAFQHKAATIS
jgi:hypothetical protein